MQELAEDVEHLAWSAYPGAVDNILEVLAKDQFIDALQDDEIRLRIRQNRPASLG